MALNNSQFEKFGTDLPGATRKRTMGQWNDRANVLAAGRSGAIKATQKSPSALTKKLGGMIMGTNTKKGK